MMTLADENCTALDENSTENNTATFPQRSNHSTDSTSHVLRLLLVLEVVVVVVVVMAVLWCDLQYFDGTTSASTTSARSGHWLDRKQSLASPLGSPLPVSFTATNTMNFQTEERFYGDPSNDDPYTIDISRNDDVNPGGSPGHADNDNDENSGPVKTSFCDRLLLGVWEKSCIMVPQQQPNNNMPTQPPNANTNRNLVGGAFLRSYPIIVVPHVNGGVDYFGYYSGGGGGGGGGGGHHDAANDGNDDANVASFLELGHAAPSRVEDPSFSQHCMALFSSQFVYYYFPTSSSTSTSQQSDDRNDNNMPAAPEWVQQDHFTFWNSINSNQVLLANRVGTTCYLQRISASSSSNNNNNNNNNKYHDNGKEDGNTADNNDVNESKQAALAECRETVLLVRTKFHHVSLALEFTPEEVCQSRL
jgi:hypothetical protein